VANLADVLVRARRHAGNRADLDASGIYESQCAALQHHLVAACGMSDAGARDAAALLNFRGPQTAEQGERLLEVLAHAERSILAGYVRPADADAKGEFWRDFVEGREVALERAISALRQRFKAVTNAVADVITSVPDNSPREHRERMPPR